MMRLRENNLLTLTAGNNVLRLLPPLVIEEIHVDEALAILEKTCGEWE
jgi:acetylornithine/N-succinyldiaminopimelate aminotransferase